MAGLRGDLRDAGAHGARPDDGDDGVTRQRRRHVYFPVKLGVRLPRKAATPSR